MNISFLNRNFWNFERIATIVLIIIGIATLVYTAHPAFLFPEKIEYNPEIRLERSLLAQQDLIFLEKGKKIYSEDKIESFEVTDSNLNEKQIYLKFVESDDTERFIFVALTDPNNIVRFVSKSLYSENPDIFVNTSLRTIMIQKPIKIRIPASPASNDLNIEGVWHLNIYLYSSQKELSLVITKPMDLSVSKEASAMDMASIFKSLIIIFFASFILIFISQIRSYFKDDTSVAVSKSDITHQTDITIDTEENHLKQPIIPPKTDGTYEVEGVIVDVHQYGLIKRCRECGQILEKGNCQKHGSVGAQGIYDLYIEPILFDGFSAHVLLIERPIIEELFKMKLNQCVTIAKENLDNSIIKDMITKQIVGRFYHVEGVYSANGLKVISMERNSQIRKEELMALYDRWKTSEFHLR